MTGAQDSQNTSIKQQQDSQCARIFSNKQQTAAPIPTIKQQQKSQVSQSMLFKQQQGWRIQELTIKQQQQLPVHYD